MAHSSLLKPTSLKCSPWNLVSQESHDDAGDGEDDDKDRTSEDQVLQALAVVEPLAHVLYAGHVHMVATSTNSVTRSLDSVPI